MRSSLALVHSKALTREKGDGSIAQASKPPCLVCAGSGAACGRQPTSGLALARVIRRARRRRPAARQDAQAWPRSAFGQDLRQGHGPDRSGRLGHATHWTGRAMAKAIMRAVQRLWEAHRLQPHRIRTFKRSNDPEWPKHAVVVSIDERAKSRRSTANRACRSPAVRMDQFRQSHLRKLAQVLL